VADTDSLERIRKALEEIDALPVEHSPAFKTAFAFRRLELECSPVAIRSLLAREAALREKLRQADSVLRVIAEQEGSIENCLDPQWASRIAKSARAALASTEPTKEAR
jgi:hypothetical protein